MSRFYEPQQPRYANNVGVRDDPAHHQPTPSVFYIEYGDYSMSAITRIFIEVFMSYLRFSMGFVLMSLAFGAAAQSMPNAGSVARDAQDKPAVLPPASTAPTMDAPANISTDTTPIAVKSVRITGATVFPESELMALVADAVGQSLTLGQLQLLAHKVTAYYQAQGYPLARAFIPAPQKIADGVVTIEVLEGKISATKLNNQSRVSDAVAQKFLSNAMDENDMMRQDRAERALHLIKDLAGTDYVGYRLAAGENKGESVLNVNLHPAPLMDGSVSEDNYGSKSTGEWRTRATVNINSPFGHGEQFSLQGMSSFKGVNYGRFGWSMPVGADGLSWRGSVSHTEYDLGGAFKDLDATGHSNSFETGFRYPWLRTERRNVFLTGGVEYRDLRDDVGATATRTDKNMKLGNLGVNASFQDAVIAGGMTQLGMTHTFGELSIDSPSARAIDAVSAKTNGQFYKLNLNASRQQYLTQKFSVVASANWQWASKNLDSSEQLSLGGVDGVVAYHSNDVSVDRGWTAKLEARYAITPYMSLAGFYDWGGGHLNAKPYRTDMDNKVRLNGGGAALYMNYRSFDVQVVAAIGKDRYTDQRSPRVWLQAGYRF